MAVNNSNSTKRQHNYNRVEQGECHAAGVFGARKNSLEEISSMWRRETLSFLDEHQEA
jgi:hypothetical protein